MRPLSAHRLLGTVTAVAALAVPLLVGGTTSAAPVAAAPQVRPSPGGAGAGDPYFPRYGNRGYSVRHYDLDVRYDPATDRLAGTAVIRARAHKHLSRLNLDLVGLRVRSVTVDGRAARWHRPHGHELVVRPRRALPDRDVFTLRVRYGGEPRPLSTPGLGLSAFLKTPDGATAIGEPEVAAHWFPVNDHPADKATYRVTLTVPRRFQAISNGLPSATTVRGRWASTTWRTRDPMTSYLAFMSVGRYDVRRSVTATGLPVIDAVDASITGAVRRRIDASLARQGEILRAESRWFGPYPFEAAGAVVDELPAFFALENQTRPIYVPSFWDVPGQPTLGDDVVVHELAHQWYGDSVALRRWRDIWLNEGFATYAEWQWGNRERGVAPRRFFHDFYAAPRDDPFWDLRIGNPGRRHLFDLQVYVRGAMTLQALRMTVGSEDFFAILRRWAQGRRHGHGTTPQLVRLAERVSGRRLDRLFGAWLFSPTKPARVANPAPAFSARVVGKHAEVRRWERGLRIRLEQDHRH